MKLSAVIAYGMLQACAVESGDEVLADDAADTSTQEIALAGSTRIRGPKMRCLGDATYDFNVRGERLWAWEGRRVAVSAIENEDVPGGRAVLLTGRIRRGAFSLSCPESLHDSTDYPSWAAFVDVNGDGECSPGDVGFQSQRYAWFSDVGGTLGPFPWSPVMPPESPGELFPPIGRETDFCSGYFD